MLKEYKEDVKSDFEGTIIDIETIGEFDDNYEDSRRYKKLETVIFGYIDRYTLEIFCAVGQASISELREKIAKIIDQLKRPFYAFNSNFEKGVLFYNLHNKVDFDRELQSGRESKRVAVRNLGISNYDDPFYDIGYYCMIAWRNGKFDDAIAHNRACLLKERDILLKRGFRKPDQLKLVRDCADYPEC